MPPRDRIFLFSTFLKKSWFWLLILGQPTLIHPFLLQCQPAKRPPNYVFWSFYSECRDRTLENENWWKMKFSFYKISLNTTCCPHCQHKKCFISKLEGHETQIIFFWQEKLKLDFAYHSTKFKLKICPQIKTLNLSHFLAQWAILGLILKVFVRLNRCYTQNESHVIISNSK